MDEIATFDGRSAPATGTRDAVDVRIAALLGRVGDRVRDARKRRGLSRRALAEKSGVSERYLAQLETGQGNISIGLLLRLAEALDFRIEWLIAEHDPWHSDIGTIATLLPRASRQQLAQVIRVLDPENPDRRRARRIALIGLRGAGKSTLGRLAAEHFDVPFLELNDDIELASGMAVHEVIALYGQEGYRHLERDALERIAATHDTLVLAVAGGIVAQPDTYAFLLRNYHTIWLKAAPEEHMTRVREQGDERPMAGNPDAMDELRKILTSREALYAQAAAWVDTSGSTLERSLADVIEAVSKNGFLDG